MTGVHGFRPLLKWPGGKTREWPALAPYVPWDVRHLVDPFMGGLAPFALTPFSGRAHLSDLHPRLVALHVLTQRQDAEFLAACDALAAAWDALGPLAAQLAPAFEALLQSAREGERAPDAASALSDAPRALEDDAFAPRLAASLADKALRLARLELRHAVRFEGAECARHGETAVRAAFYGLVREREHGATGAAAAADFLFVREYCYGSMFRQNADGAFNIPYGGASYNAKPFARKVERLRDPRTVAALARAEFACGDFGSVLADLAPHLERRDLVFLDPPYDSDFSAYGGNEFGIAEHERLADLMARLPCRYLFVIKETADVRRIYVEGAPARAGGRVVLRFGKTYGYNVRGRNDRDARHVVLTNA